MKDQIEAIQAEALARIAAATDSRALEDARIPFDPSLVGVGEYVEDISREAATRLLRRADRTVYLWADEGGEPVALVGAGGRTPRGIRIGPVYTPPAHRGRGYASNLVAAVTQRQFDDGRAFCFLFTNLANPTSNRIYQGMGYQPVIDIDQWQFTGDRARESEVG